jgi:hypothetical protein
MGPFHLAIESGAPRLDIDMSDSQVLYMPMEHGLEFMAVFGPHCMDTKGELFDHIVNRINGFLLGVLLVDFQVRMCVASSIAVY